MYRDAPPERSSIPVEPLLLVSEANADVGVICLTEIVSIEPEKSAVGVKIKFPVPVAVID